MESYSIQPDKIIGHILCCQCGAEIEPNPSNMCVSCVRTTVDITEGIPKQATLHFCKNCERYLQPPSEWVKASLESKELLTICLQKLKGLNRIHLVDASFVWTEPHSKRLKVKLTVQAEIQGGTKLQQVFVVEYTVAYQMCEDCHRQEAQIFWKALVQVRQKAENKKTMYFLEQVIIKHRAHELALEFKPMHGGLDFFFANESNARKFVDFLNSVLPIRYQHSKKLISHDIHSNIYNYKYTFSVEVIPLSKGSLVCLPKGLTQQLGGISPLCLVNRVSSTVQLIDPKTSQIAEISSLIFWRHPFNAICNPKELGEYTVMNVEKIIEKKKNPGQGPLSNKHVVADVWLVKSSSLGTDNNEIHTRTHIGHLLNPGDNVLCYNLLNNNINDNHFEKVKDIDIPSIVILKKFYKHSNNKRIWKLKHLNQENIPKERDFMEFMNDLEEDKLLRSHINIYKDSSKVVNTAVDQDDEDDDPAFSRITLDEMLDDLTLDEAAME